jgi:hypothetical protein
MVPALWLYEVVNAIEFAVRKGRITAEKANGFPESLADLPVEMENLDMLQMFVSVRLWPVSISSPLTTLLASNWRSAVRSRSRRHEIRSSETLLDASVPCRHIG